MHSHPAFAVDWHKEADGHSGDTSVSLTVDAAQETESYDEVSNPKISSGRRGVLTTNTSASATADAADIVVAGRATASTTATLRRQHSGQAFAAWVQSIDAASLTYTPHNVHITRSVYDLKDQVTEVHDARDLGFATWTFTFDHAGNRIVTAHATAMGTRYALTDAAGNPIWARDAKALEVDRTFDVLQRPLSESSDDGTTVKLRRQWNYITYNPSDPNFATHKGNNLFGQVEEVRDADGLRYFEYDWRGLLTKTSHRFWSQNDGTKEWDDGTSTLWSTGSSWDPAIPSTARGSLTDWLVLDNLTDTTTVVIETSWDAAARPTQVDYPESMATRMSYNTAGNLDKIEVDRGTGAGFADVIEDLRYDARGKLTELTHGNGVVSKRTYDNDLERLTRIFTELPGTPDVEFQDLNYAYDPAGNPVQIEDALTTSTFKANQIIPNTRDYYYDPRNRLVRSKGKKHATVSDRSTNVLVSSPDPNDYDAYDITYAYDEVGNFRVNQEYNSSKRAHLNYKADRIDLFNGTNGEAIDERPDQGNYRYDANGNTTHTPRQDELGYTFDNQPNYVDLGGGGEVRYFRHADQRVVRMVNKTGVKALGIYLGPWEYHQRQGSTAYTKVVVHIETTTRHAQVERVLSGSDPDSVDVFYVHSDHLGSGHVLTSASGTLLSQEEFFAYGRASDRRDARNRYRYIGVERDEDTGLCMTGPRTYDPVMGRFGQGDPLPAVNADISPRTLRGLLGSASHAYARSSPTRWIDGNGYAPHQKAGNYDQTTDLNRLRLLLRARNIDSLEDATSSRGWGGSPMSSPNNQAKPILPRYIWTRNVGWIDLKHFFVAARRVEMGFSPLTVVDGGAALELPSKLPTRFSYEDLQSNLQGAWFGAENTHPREQDGTIQWLGTSRRDLKGEDFHDAVLSTFSRLDAGPPQMAPNWPLPMRYPKRPPTNTTYTPMYAPASSSSALPVARHTHA